MYGAMEPLRRKIIGLLLASLSAVIAGQGSTAEAGTRRIPWQGFSTMTYSPRGALCQILCNESTNLVYRERYRDGTVFEEAVKIAGPGAVRGYQPVLLFDAGGNPNIVDGRGPLAWYRYQGGMWQRVADITPPYLINELSGRMVAYTNYYGTWLQAPVNEPRHGLFSGFAAGFAPDGTLCVALCDDVPHPPGQIVQDTHQIVVGSNRGGAWSWVVVDRFTQHSEAEFYIPPRYFQMVVDKQNFIHVLYTPGFTADFDVHYHSELRYASNRSGAWRVEVVSAPLDDHGDAAWGGSLAVDGSGNAAVASFFIERFITGSPHDSQLLYHRRQANGTWTREIVVSQPDGYVGADGPAFTGAYPALAFDHHDRPHIVFCDHATQHWPYWQCVEYSGQIRYAYNNGSGWAVRTLYRQTDAPRNHMRYPILAVTGDQVAYAGMRSSDVLDADGRILSTTEEYVEGRIPHPDPCPELADGVDAGNGWKWLPWFGYYWMGAYPPYIYHPAHGWCVPVGDCPQSLFLYTYDMGWLWIDSRMYPWVCRVQPPTWLYYVSGTSNPRWFYNFSTARYEPWW